MLLNALHLENYKQYRLLDLEFREGLVGVIGKNGAGKSTLFEAILYCLFGRDESNKFLIRSAFAAPKDLVELRLDFTLSEVLYRVRREFRGKAMAPNAELFKNDVLIAKGVTAVNDEIVKLLHLERDAFRRSVFSGQKELSQLSDTTGEARKKMVRKMLGLDTLDDIQSAVNTDRKSLEQQMLGQRQNLLTEEETGLIAVNMEAQTAALTELDAPLQEAAAQLAATQSEYQIKKLRFDQEARRLQEHNDRQAELGRLHSQQEELGLRRRQLESKRVDLEQQQQKLDLLRPGFLLHEADVTALRQSEQVAREQQRHDQLRSRIEAQAEPLRQSRERLADLSDAGHLLRELATELVKKQALLVSMDWNIEEKNRAWQAFTNRVSALTGRIQEREDKIKALKSLGPDSDCPTCGRPLLEAYEDVLYDLNAEIRELQLHELHALEQERIAVKAELNALLDHANREKEDLALLQTDQIRLEEQVKLQQREALSLQQLENQLAQQIAELQALEVLSFSPEQHQALQVRVRQGEADYRQFKSDEDYLQREWPATQRDLLLTGERLADNLTRITATEAALLAVAYDAAAYDLAKADFTSFDAVLLAQTERVRDLERRKLELESSLSRDRDRLRTNARIQQQISDKAEESDLLRKIGEHLNEFKTEILEKVSPSISREASELFSRITKGKYESILVDDNFDFAIADGGLYYPIERFSGGEIDLANFCLRIAITKAIMELSGSGQRIEFLAFDEVFGSQDEERRHEMMLALNYLQEQFRQIYIVSHIESLRDYFPNILEVKYGADGSGVDWV